MCLRDGTAGRCQAWMSSAPFEDFESAPHAKLAEHRMCGVGHLARGEQHPLGMYAKGGTPCTPQGLGHPQKNQICKFRTCSHLHVAHESLRHINDTTWLQEHVKTIQANIACTPSHRLSQKTNQQCSFGMNARSQTFQLGKVHTVGFLEHIHALRD